MVRLTFQVVGIPKPKGSWRCVGRHGRHRLVEQVDSSSWQNLVIAEAINAMRSAGLHKPLAGAIAVSLRFVTPLPKSIKPERRRWPALAQRVGDIDKLSRNVLDCLTRAGVWADDGQVCVLNACKLYPHTMPGDARPGVTIEIEQLADKG